MANEPYRLELPGGYWIDFDAEGRVVGYHDDNETMTVRYDVE